MEDSDILDSLDASGELSEAIRARKWLVVSDICDRKIKKGDTRDAFQVPSTFSISFEDGHRASYGDPVLIFADLEICRSHFRPKT